MDEATYLTAILDSTALLDIVQPLQARGEHNPRDFDKYVWRAPIPLYEPANSLHQQLVEIGGRAAKIAATVELPNQSFQALRRRVRTALAQAEELAEWDAVVRRVLGNTHSEPVR
jgi:hypothetical protein